jgi:hypothetical protein
LGILIQELQFNGSTPDLARIGAAIVEVCGLPVVITESGPEVKGTLYALHARMAFDCDRSNTIDLFSYRPGAVRELYRQFTANIPPDLAQPPRALLGVNEPEGSPSIHLRTYVGLEPTLLMVTTLALEALGGEAKRHLSDEARRTYSRRLTSATLKWRTRKTQWISYVGMIAFVLLLPINLLLMVPQRWRMRRRVAEAVARLRKGSD